MRRLGNLVLAFLILTVLLCNGAAACISADEFLANHGDKFSEAESYEGREAELANDIFEALVPDKTSGWNFVILATLKEGGGVMFVGKYRTVCAAIQFLPHQWEILLRSVRGVGA